jgi:hypothetical protein
MSPSAPSRHVSASVKDPIDPGVNVIFEAARQGRLVMCAGAGLGVAKPAELPSGTELGVDLDLRLAGLLAGYESPADPADLIAVADAGAGLEGGEAALRGEVLQLADFKGAEPNYGHTATAELLCEGGISLLLLWNWDTCIERVDVSPDLLQVSRSASDLRNLTEPSIAKVHGCATRRATMLITSEDLKTPPVWADQATREHLRGKTVVFVGVGDIADYAKRRLAELRDDLESAAAGTPLDIWVVSPGIKAKWATSAWSELLPSLPEERRLALSADDFFDQLSRRWAREALDSLGTATAQSKPATKEAVEALSKALDVAGSAKVLRWSRSAALGQSVGDSVVLNSALTQLLVGFAVLARDTGAKDIHLRGPAVIAVDGKRVEALLTCGGSPAEKVRNRARERARKLADQGLVDNSASFMVAGPVVGALEDDPDLQLDMAVGASPSDDLVAGSSSVRLSFHLASDLEKAA